METRSGLKSTEFWISAVVAVLGLTGPTLLQTYGSEEALPEWARVATQLAGAGLAALAALGYTASRAGVKKAQLDAKARDVEARAKVKSAETEARARSGNLLGLFVVCGLLLGTLGCTAPSAYDPVTVQQIDATVTFEERDFNLSREALEDCGAEETALRSLEVRHEAELARLEAWRQAEEAKKLPE